MTEETTTRESTESDTTRETEDDGETATKRVLPLDQVFEILKNRRRRDVLHYLNSHDGTATLSDLAEHIAAKENDTTVDAISSSQRKRVYVGLYQCHLPKMDDMDIVEFDQNRGNVELAPNAEQLQSYLAEDGVQRNWSRLYLGLSAVGVVLFAGSQVGGSAIGLTSSVAMVVLIAGTSCCAIAHSLLDGEDESD